MNSWIKLIIHFLILITHFIAHADGSAKKFSFVEYNDIASTFNSLSCARLAQMEGACGCKKDVNNDQYYSLWQTPWCSTRSMESDYVYMETQTMRMVPSWKWEFGGWTFQVDIPVCMTPGSVIRWAFIPRTGSTRTEISLRNINSDYPMTVIFKTNPSKASYQSTFNNTDVHDVNWDTSVGVYDGYPYMTDVTYTLEIEVLEYSYKSYADGLMLYEYPVNTTETAPVAMTINIYGNNAHNSPQNMYTE